MRYVVRRSEVYVLGRLWWPYGVVAAQTKLLDAYDLRNLPGADGRVTRTSLAQWLMCNSGDFSEVVDFAASLEIGDATVIISWNNPESDLQFILASEGEDA